VESVLGGLDGARVGATEYASLAAS
jgi:hypothetical protein